MSFKGITFSLATAFLSLIEASELSVSIDASDVFSCCFISASFEASDLSVVFSASEVSISFVLRLRLHCSNFLEN